MEQLDLQFNMKESIKFLAELKKDNIIFEKMSIDTGFKDYDLTPNSVTDFISVIEEDVGVGDEFFDMDDKGTEYEDLTSTLSVEISFTNKDDETAFKLIWV